MKTTRFGYEIIKASEEVLGIGYRSFGKNYFGDKLEEVVKMFDAHDSTKYYAGKGKKQPDYCAITASVILDIAFKNYNGSHNKLRHASAYSLANKLSGTGVRTDKKPAIGSLFVYQRNDKGQGHVGFVWKVGSNYIQTIEGNTESGSSFIIKDGCATKLNRGEYGILTRQRKSPYITTAGYPYSFIHIEELFGAEVEEFEPSINYLADESLYCEIIDPADFDFDGSDGESEEPKETTFFGQHKEKFIYGVCAVGLLTLGLWSKFEK